MKVVKLGEAFYQFAMLGMSLSREQDPDNMPAVARRVAGKGGGHDKVLESVMTCWDITGPRYWWMQVATYRAPEGGDNSLLPSGITIQSESTMYTILKRPISQDDFAAPIDENTLIRLNWLVRSRNFDAVKNELPEGYLQRRIVVSNYKALANIISQRRAHKLAEWQTFCQAVLAQVEHPELLPGA